MDCPTCHRPLIDRTLFDDGTESILLINGTWRRLPKMLWDLLSILRNYFGCFVARERIFVLMYGMVLDQPSMRVIVTHVCRLRKALVGSILRIENQWGRGWRLVSD